jgi:molybdopterin synthase sulfur carrier subunit
MTTDTKPSRKLTLCYFSWIREKVGKEKENVLLPPDVYDVSDLIDWLILEGGTPYANAFENRQVTRAAIDNEYVCFTTLLEGAMEVAFFPPVTGG